MRKAGDIISALFKGFGNEFLENAKFNAELYTSWEGIVADIWPHGTDYEKGDIPAAAVHSRIRELERGVLLIEADHPGWVQILQTKQAELLKAVQRLYPKLEISGIAFTLSRGPLSAPEKKENFAEKPVDSEVPVSCQEKEYVPAPRDDEFYTALRNLEKTVSKRKSSR